MKTRNLSSLVRKQDTLLIDLFRFLPQNKAVVASVDEMEQTIYIGVVKLGSQKVRPVLRSCWRGKSPLVRFWKEKDVLVIDK